MTDNDTGIDQSAFLARVAAQTEKKAADAASANLSGLVGYVTPVPHPATAPRSNGSNGTAHQNGHSSNGRSRNGVPKPPRIPSLKDISPALAEQVKRDADEMFEDFHTERSELDILVDQAIAGLNVLKAYRLWIRKMDPRVYDGQTESIKISCPIPGHEDTDPSAWINTVKGEGGLWHCGGCQQGGDKYDLAAIGLGYNFATYKTDGSFRNLTLDMARQLGVDVDKHLLGPAARAYKAAQEQAHKQPEPNIPAQTRTPEKSRPIQPVVPDARDKSEIDKIEALNAKIAEEAARDHEKRKKRRAEAEATWRHAKPTPPSPLVSPIMPTITTSVPEEAAEQAPGLDPSMPAPAVGSRGVMPNYTGFSLAPPVPATQTPPTQEKQQPPVAPPPGFKPLAQPLIMPMPGGSMFVSQPKPVVDMNDPGMIKAMLEDEGVKAEPEEESDEFTFATLDFKTLVPEDTFLGKYCSILLESDSPDEWNFWNAMAGLGVAVGKRLGMVDRIRVFSNIYVCLLGETTSGKSISKKYITQLLKTTLPWVANDPTNTSPKLIRGTASGEFLLSKFRDDIRDPAQPSKILESKKVSALIEYDELATVMAKANGPSSNFVPILQGLFDGYEDVESGSFQTGDKVALDPFASLLTSTQPSMLQRLVGREHVDNGFLNRFIFAVANKKTQKDEDLLGGEFMDVSPAAPYLRSVHEWAVENAGRDIGWTPQSLAMGREFIREVVSDNESNKDNKLIQRSDLLVKKFMMLFAVNMRSNVVTAEAVQSATQIYPYLIDSYSFLDKTLTATESSELRSKILLQVGRLTVRDNKPPTRRDIHNALGRVKVDAESLVRAIKTLCEVGDLKEIKWPLPGMPAVGRPSVRYGLASDD